MAPVRTATASVMLSSAPQLMQRRLREGLEFFAFLRERRGIAH